MGRTSRRQRALRPTFEGQGFVSVAFSPDGSRLAAGTEEGTVKLWDVTSGAMRRELAGPASHVMSVAFSPDGETVAVGVSDSKVMLWRVRDGKLVHTFLGHSGPVWSAAFSPNGMQLASVGNRAKLWDVDALLLCLVALALVGGWRKWKWAA